MIIIMRMMTIDDNDELQNEHDERRQGMIMKIVYVYQFCTLGVEFGFSSPQNELRSTI